MWAGGFERPYIPKATRDGGAKSALRSGQDGLGREKLEKSWGVRRETLAGEEKTAKRLITTPVTKLAASGWYGQPAGRVSCGPGQLRA